MVSYGGQYRLLLWKNWILVRRKPVVTAFEVLLPTLLSIILLVIRSRMNADVIVKPTRYPSFAVEDNLPVKQSLPTQRPVRNVLLYTPNNSLVTRIVQRVTTRLKMEPSSIVFDSELDIEEYVRKASPDSYLASVVFNNLHAEGPLPPQVSYSIRPKSDFAGEPEEATLEQSYAWSTNLMYPSKTTPKVRESSLYGLAYPGYYSSGFLSLQRAVDFSLMEEINRNLSLENVEVRLKRFPDPKSRHDPFVSVLQEQFPLIIMLSFIVSAPAICKDIVLEKEKKLKESMKLMGMNANLYWLAWILKFIICMMISVGIMTVIFHVKTGKGAMITYTDPSVTFVFLTLFTITVIVFCCAMSTFFSHSNSGAAAGAILYIILYMPYFFLSFRMDSLSYRLKMILSLDNNLAMAFGCVLLAQYEDMGVGVQWNNLHKPVNINDKFTMADVFTMMAVDIVYLTLITWYFDAMLPGDFGMPQPFYFPFTTWYWFGRTDQKIRSSLADDSFAAPSYGKNSEFFEEGDPFAKVGIRIRHLRKIFRGAPKPSVVDLSIDMYVGEITALLGHNGAGKTTTMYMLTGFLPPTEGTAYINGLDIRRDMVRIRQSLGLCPQHDILFDKLTVVEHLTFFAKLKGCPNSKVQEEVDKMVEVLQLKDKRDTFSKNLSGGMKRKLSVGIALIAGSKFVILDEPTSGMDPEARRETWDILLNQRADRTIILSTHFMDEADLLGDRIAIMAEGELKCCGSAMFLKKKYGIGYHLTIVRNSKSKSKRITKLIRSFVPQAHLEAKVGSELAYILPKEMSVQFEDLFNAIERNRQSLGVDSYGASVTTMEEVFIRVGESANKRTPSISEPKGPRGQEIDYSMRPGTRPVSATVSGIHTEDSETSGSTMGSSHTFGRPASATGVSVDRSLPLASMPNQSPNPVLLNYLQTKLAKLRESRSKKPDTDEVIDRVTHIPTSVAAADAHDTLSLTSGPPSETDLHTLSETFLQDPTPVMNVPAAQMNSEARTAATVSSASTSYQSWEASKPIGAKADAALSSEPELKKPPKPADASAMRRELSNPEIKSASVAKPVKALKREKSRKKSVWLKGVPEDETELSKASLESSDSSSDAQQDVFFTFSSVSGVRLMLYHYRAMFIKRIIHSWRNRMVTSVQMIVPVFFLVIACVIEMFLPTAGSPLALPLRLTYFGAVSVPVAIDPNAVDRNTAQALRLAYTKIVENPPVVENVRDDDDIDTYLLKVAERDMEDYRRQFVIGGTFNTTSWVNKSIVGHFSNEAFHTIAMSLSLVDATLMKHLVGDDHSIMTTNYPLPRSDNIQASSEIINQRMAGFVFAYCMTFGIAFLLSTFIVFPIKEHSIRSRHVQYVSGIRPVNYWVSTFVWDMLNYILPAIFMICVFKVFEIKAYTAQKNLFYVFMLLIFYALAMLPVTYLESLGFQEAASGYVWATVINIMSDTMAMVVVYICKMPGVQAMEAAEALEWLFYATLPNYCFSGGLQSLYENYMNFDLCDSPNMKLMCLSLIGTNVTNLCCPGFCGKLCAKMNSNYLGIEYPGIGRSLVFLSSHCILYFLILLASETSQAHRARRRVVAGMRIDVDTGEDMDDELEQDSDVKVERKRVLETPLQELLKDDILVLKEVTKIYSNDFLAVDRLTIGIKPGECFGLLGINGAGKTTTFKMLTGDEMITSGECYVDGFNLSNELRKAHHLLGYCPQFDALIDQMTVTETLWMFARLRGVVEKDIEDIVDSLISLVLLEKHRFKESGKLSGGNRRKLSTAVALTGNPKIIFLDEPTTGMDPSARRLLWNTLAKVRDSGRTLVLTSHSMEECEALCTRLAIMVNGRFKCLGSTQHLKTKFGRGYTVIVKIRSASDQAVVQEKVKQLIDFFTEIFPGSTLKDRHEGLVHFHIHTVGATWAIIFGTMERIKADFDIDDYSVSQTTLEQVFVSFARVQQTMTVKRLTCGQKCSKFCCPYRKIT